MCPEEQSHCDSNYHTGTPKYKPTYLQSGRTIYSHNTFTIAFEYAVIRYTESFKGWAVSRRLQL